MDSLEDLVDVAIDSEKRAIHDRSRGRYAVLDEGVHYYYDPEREPETHETTAEPETHGTTAEPEDAEPAARDSDQRVDHDEPEVDHDEHEHHPQPKQSE